MIENYTVIEQCRICGCKDLEIGISLPAQFLSPTFVKSNIDNPLAKIKVPMTLMVCNNNDCSLVQLKESTNLTYYIQIIFIDQLQMKRC